MSRIIYKYKVFIRLKFVVTLTVFSFLTSCAVILSVPHSNISFNEPMSPEKGFSLVFFYNSDDLGKRELFWIDGEVATHLTAKEYSYVYIREGVHKLSVGENAVDLELTQDFKSGLKYFYRWESGLSFTGAAATMETTKILRVPNKFAEQEIKNYFYNKQEKLMFD